MVTTAIQRHYDRVLAEKRGTATAGDGADDVPAAVARAEAGLRGLVVTHLAELKATKGRERKATAKARFLPDYESHVAAVLAADAGGADDVLMTVMIWRLDIADYDGALAIADHALRHGVPLPARFARDLPDLLVEEIAERALAAVDTALVGEDPAGAAALTGALTRVLSLTADLDVHDAVAAKAHKALGRLLAATAPAEAAGHLEAALRFDPKGAGVKTELGRPRKRIADGDDADTDRATG